MSQPIYIPDDAPFNAEQRAWLNEFFAKTLAGLPSGSMASQGPSIPVTILWGSQTGNAEGIAKKLAKAMNQGGYDAKTVDMADYDVSILAQEKHLLLITSTYGDGEPPDNAAAFHEAILSDTAPKLEGLKYAVFGLGDTEYPDYCLCAIQFDERLAALGAERVLPLVQCDVDFDDEFAQWKKDTMAVFGANAQVAAVEEDDVEDGYSKQNPFPSPILENRNLNLPGGEKETHHVSFSLEGSGLEYEVGDALGVLPRNPEGMVDDIIAALPFNTKEEVFIGKKEISLREALIEHYDIRSLNKKLLTEWQARSGAPLIRSLIESDDAKAIEDFCWGRELIDLVIEFPADFGDAEEFLGVLKKLQPRLYSIASSPKAHPGEVHLTVGIIRYHSHYRDRGGVCSTFLSDRTDGVNPGVYMHHNKAFRVPADASVPMIMVGPGTGIAPFRAFLEERKAIEAPGKNWLFFGNPHRATDFLYEDELTAMQEAGVLNKLSTAFSRDQAQKVYVQDRMIEEGEELWKWLSEGGYFYVCGDASRMAKDVDKALHQVIQTHGKMSEEEAAQYVSNLKKEKRYARDVY